MIKVTATGRLVDNPVLRTVGDEDKTVCQIRLASNKPRGRNGANFLDVAVWFNPKQHADNLVKGQALTVSGDLNHNQWEDNEGNKRERYELIAEDTEWGAKPAARSAEEPANEAA